MPNCDWYGIKADHRMLLDWLFADNGCAVLEHYSKFERPIHRFRSTDEVLTEFDGAHPGGKRVSSIYLSLWPHECGPRVPTVRFKLDPAVCDGATWRESCDGICVQFYLADTLDGRLENSHTNTASPQRMGAVNGTYVGQKGEAWDIGAINRFSARINRKIKSWAVARIDGRIVMHGAAQAWSQSVELSPYKPDEHAAWFQKLA